MPWQRVCCQLTDLLWRVQLQFSERSQCRQRASEQAAGRQLVLPGPLSKSSLCVVQVVPAQPLQIDELAPIGRQADSIESQLSQLRQPLQMWNAKRQVVKVPKVVAAVPLRPGAEAQLESRHTGQCLHQQANGRGSGGCSASWRWSWLRQNLPFAKVAAAASNTNQHLQHADSRLHVALPYSGDLQAAQARGGDADSVHLEVDGPELPPPSAHWLAATGGTAQKPAQPPLLCTTHLRLRSAGRPRHRAATSSVQSSTSSRLLRAVAAARALGMMLSKRQGGLSESGMMCSYGD